MLSLRCKSSSDLTAWRAFVRKSKNGKDVVKIAVVGKYFNSGDFILSDVYLSVLEAIKYSAYKLNLKPEIHYLSSIEFDDGKSLKKLEKYDGVLIPGGFGTTGIEGKINVVKYVRTHNIPYFGICYGMHMAIIEYARNVARLKGAHTFEIDPKTPHPVIGVMDTQKDHIKNGNMGGTMRLGKYPTDLKKGSRVAKVYKAKKISERHRHRYEVNPEYLDLLTEKGIVFSGVSPDGKLMEIMELPEHIHPFFVGVQFHPEFHARPLNPHPLFTAFVKAAYESR
jgi:CTP synthase